MTAYSVKMAKKFSYYLEYLCVGGHGQLYIVLKTCLCLSLVIRTLPLIFKASVHSEHNDCLRCVDGSDVSNHCAMTFESNVKVNYTYNLSYSSYRDLRFHFL